MLALFPAITASAKSSDLEELSILVRQYFAGDDATKPRLDAVKVIRQFGLPIGWAPIKYFGAIAVKDDRGIISGSMIVREPLDPVHQTFLVCHLLGHFLIHIQPRLSTSDWRNSGFKELIDPLRRYAYGDGTSNVTPSEFALEDLADRFAGALLMPAAMVRRAHERLIDIRKVAMVFGVLPELVERRLEDLNAYQPRKSSAIAEPRPIHGGRAATSIDLLQKLADSELSDQKKLPQEVPPEQLIRDGSQPRAAASRAIAAHSYSDAAQHEKPEQSPSPQPDGLKGMARLRELAMKMDKFSDRSK